jgi:carbon-monoxide dehydrogenase large subunit
MISGALTKSGRLVGQSVVRVEDARLVTGRSRFVDDVDLPSMLHAAVLRSPLPHAAIRGIDTAAARELPGVAAVLTADDLRRLGIGPMQVTWLQPDQKCKTYPLLANGKTHYVGEALAVVAASSRYVAEDALDLISVDYDGLPPLLDPERAAEGGAMVLHEEWGDNVIAQIESVSGDFERASQEADLTVSGRFRSQRYMAMPLETRGAVARADRFTRELTFWVSNQAPHRVRAHLAEILGWPEHMVRVIVGDVGGGFGLKDHVYAEEILTAVLSIETGRPVKWIEDRQEHFFGSVHAREQLHTVELAVKSDGTMVGISDRIVTDGGAYTSNVGLGPTATTVSMLPGPYRIPNYDVTATAVATTKVPNGAYRGFGQPEAVFAMERIIDRAARELAIDPAEMRLRNLIAPDEFPYVSAAGLSYDSGDYETALRRTLELLEYDAWRERQQSWRAEGRYLGIGLAMYVEMTGLASSKDLAFVGFHIGGYETVNVTVDQQGRVTVRTGMVSTGQSHATTLAQVAADTVGVRFEDVTVVQGDTDSTPLSLAGAIGSRGAGVGGTAVIRAGERVREKLISVAAHLLEAAPADLEVREGALFVQGEPEARMTVAEVAEQAILAHNLPEGMTPGVDERYTHDPESLTFGYAAHGVVLEVLPGTGQLDFLKYAIVHDCGTMINPAVVEGQMVGGMAQGMGGALLEELVYDESGQLTTASLMDYLLPTVREVPPVVLDHLEVPAPGVPGGMKGAGEGGAIAPPAAVANAVEDALSPLGVNVDSTPLSPSAVWALVNASAERSGEERRS